MQYRLQITHKRMSECISGAATLLRAAHSKLESLIDYRQPLRGFELVEAVAMALDMALASFKRAWPRTRRDRRWRNPAGRRRRANWPAIPAGEAYTLAGQHRKSLQSSPFWPITPAIRASRPRDPDMTLGWTVEPRRLAHSRGCQGIVSESEYAEGRVVFNIKGNDYRLVAAVQHRAGALAIRFFGSHPEYDRIDAETV